jgi:Co/Zn/Cd efflux system component
MSCGHSDESTETASQRRVLRIALALNATMFIVGVVAGLVGQSSSLIADALDMLADASAYAIALGAIGRSTRFKAGAATLSGSLLLLLGVLVLLDVGRRALFGSEPESLVMMAVALLSLIVNATVLRMLVDKRDSAESRRDLGSMLIQKFARDSPLEGDGFELPVPGRETVKPSWEK